MSRLDWQAAGGRRIQFYGHWYEVGKGGVYRVGDLPAWPLGLAQRLHDDRLMPYVAACVMEFMRHGSATEAVLLEPGSAVVFAGAARPRMAARDSSADRRRLAGATAVAVGSIVDVQKDVAAQTGGVMTRHEDVGMLGRRDVLQALGLLLAAGFAPAFAQAKPLRIGIIGTGRIGGALATHWTKAGHEVLMSSRHPDELRPLATSLGARARVGTPRDAAGFGEVVLVSVPYAAIPDIGRDNASQLKGKVVVDTSNPVEGRDGAMALAAQKKGAGVATAEFLPGTRVVRAFNCIPAASLANNANRKPERIAIPIGGDDAQALAVAERLVRDAGFDPVVVGTLAQSRQFDLGQPLASGQFTAAELRKAMKS